ncbi:MAG: hypothetical protein PUB46_08530 [Lachnospiraceae bacterium]|uniref:hypothetical protein n=1 Tax=Roseburia hominis TaxID=301301 RepID=UPI001F2266A1|nr:hypothetical protein [Roseburia hominis]MCI5712389.1 hypothetical protein [Lachnospiraceae bacterium]MDD6170108.1 hypothetical protein [Lachnospiraceae bacterium]MDY4839557.1 hypothetical protein [Lachnospiraceae bacterium]
MSTVELRSGRKIKVVTAVEQQGVISNRDAEMDARAVQAVKSAVKKAEFCKKPVAKYDKVAKKAYVQYADGVRKYVD